MTDREKLIELLDHKVDDDWYTSEEIADYLLSNGVRLETEQATSNENKRWISVSERLPENGENVLVWFEYFRYGSYNRLFRTIGTSYTFRGEWSGFVNGESGWCKLKILAWMPLPEPPKEENNEA